ncbi:OmpP1/FadL family transporter [Mangrovivirga cuniculi]|uniref:Long-chain fatty acid transport protein n=1 Tax=Mangrovivirga cuniculi TaxID=2715131 RepID=A0A4D7JWS7_9BACT|nr:outer membrane protein transport protein [Mangrovivirga cuniculi]QCK16576.1 hypothetical protein DCC35_18505 [Mangrovivirga cuniculi]
MIFRYNWLYQGLAVLLGLVIYTKAHGQSAYNPNILPMGDKEPLMANTGTGGLASTGAVYYNPAALTMLEGTSFSLSGTAYLHYKFTANPIGTINGQDLKYEASGFQTVPTSIVMVKSYKDWKVAFSVLTPMDFRYEGLSSWTINGPDQALDVTFLQNYKENMLLVGLSAAKKINEQWSWGASLYYQGFSFSTFIEANTIVNNNPERLIQQSSRTTIRPKNIMIIAGIQHEGEKMNFGIKLTTPSIYLFGKGDYYNYNFSNINPDNITADEINLTGIKTKFKTPGEIRAGITYKPGVNWTIASDIGYSFKLNYDIYPDNEIEERESLRGNFRVSSGAEYLLSDRISLYSGGSYTPSLEKPGEGEKGVAFWAFFTGFKLKSKYFHTDLGLFYSIGNGEQPKAVGTGITKLRYRYLGAFLGTNYTF